MARAVKKKKEQSIEEKLTEALVPVGEQPYQVPENWCWTQGINIFSPMETQRPEGEKFKYIDIDSIDNKRQLVSTPKEMLVTDAPSRASRKLHQGDTVFSMVRPYLKNIAYIDGSIADSIASTGFYVCTPRLLLNPRYCYYLMVSPYVIDGLNAFMKGDNSPSIRKSDLENFVYPLPPLPEQQRIVDRIESLFAKLDEAKEKAQAVVDGFEDRKAAILHKAFTGELTAGWRSINSIDGFTWDKKRINQISLPRAGYAFDSKKFVDSGYQIIRMGNLYGGTLDLSRNPVFISPDNVDEKTLIRSLINDGDILITLTGTKYKRDYGYAVCIHGRDNLLVNQRILCLSPNDSILTNYLLYYLQCDLFRDVFFSSETGGVNQGNVSSKFVENIEIPLPSKKEQLKIVEILDRIIEKEATAFNVAEQVISQIETMKKSILARAFRGELSTNDPADESAVELLKRIL